MWSPYVSTRRGSHCVKSRWSRNERPSSHLLCLGKSKCHVWITRKESSVVPVVATVWCHHSSKSWMAKGRAMDSRLFLFITHWGIFSGKCWPRMRHCCRRRKSGISGNAGVVVILCCRRKWASSSSRCIGTNGGWTTWFDHPRMWSVCVCRCKMSWIESPQWYAVTKQRVAMWSTSSCPGGRAIPV